MMAARGMSTPATIGVITGLDLVGDALIKLPFLRALRSAYPAAKIHWITSLGSTSFGSQLREVTSNLIDEIHQQPIWVTDPKDGQAPFFDLLIDTRGKWRETLRARQLPHNIFISRATRYLFSDRRPPLFHKRPLHLCDRLLEMVELVSGAKAVSSGSLNIPADLIQKAKNILPAGPTYIGLAPGCSTVHRMWPRERFEELAHIQISKGRVPVFILGPMEQDIYSSLKAKLPEAKFPLQEIAAWGGELGINHSLAIGPQLALAVTNDSGPGHIMAAAGCPVLSLFGPTTPLKAAPRVAGGVSVRAQNFGSDAMTAIPVNAVAKAVDQMLASAR